MRPLPAVAPNRAVVLAVTSGKGGVGKTHLAVNVSIALTRLGYRVAIVDADFGLGNVDVMLGLTPEAHVGHLLTGEKTLADVLVEGPRGLSVLPAGSGVQPLTALTPAQKERLSLAIDEARTAFDFLILDTASGIADHVMDLLRLVEHVLLVTSLDPASLVDAYAVAKVLWNGGSTHEIGLVVNGVRDGIDGRLAFKQLDLAAARFLGRHLQYLGYIPEDDAVREAILVQRPIVEHLPHSPASRSLRLLAARLAALGTGPQGLRAVSGGAFVSSSPEVPQCA